MYSANTLQGLQGILVLLYSLVCEAKNKKDQQRRYRCLETFTTKFCSIFALLQYHPPTAPHSPQKLQSHNALHFWQHFLSTWEGRDSDANKCPWVCCRGTLEITVKCQVGLTDNLATLEPCGSNPKRFCWKMLLNCGSPRRITSISCCRGDEGTEKVVAVWQVMFVVLLSYRIFGTAAAASQTTRKHAS